MSASADGPDAPVDVERIARRITRDRTDPTGTAPIAERYYADLRDRYEAVRDEVVRVVGEADIFGLDPVRAEGALLARGGVSPSTRGNTRTPSTNGDRGGAGHQYAAHAPPVPPLPGYDFPQNGVGLARFLRWLDTAMDVVVLGVGPQGGPDAFGWTDEYVRNGYARGLTHADAALRAQGYPVDPVDLADTFNLPVHRDTLEVFYRRQYELLDGINSASKKEIQRTLADSFIKGENPRVAARKIAQRVDAVGLNRAEILARTEMVYAENEAALNRYERVLGPGAEVTAMVEWLTAGDNRVCEHCASLDGTRYTLKEAHGLLPLHPRCRCTWIALV